MLDKASDPGVQGELASAIAKSDLKQIRRTNGAIDSQEDISHKVVHIIVGNGGSKDLSYYSTKHIRFGSMYIGKRVAQLFAWEQKDELRVFLASSDTMGEFGALRGKFIKCCPNCARLSSGRLRAQSPASRRDV